MRQRRLAPATSMRRLSCQKISAHGFWLEGAMLTRREWISLPYELARESGSRLDPMSLRAECDHLVIGLALRRLCRRTVITPRLASIPSLLLKAVCFCLFGSARRCHLGQRSAHCFSWANSINDLPRRCLLIQSC